MGYDSRIVCLLTGCIQPRQNMPLTHLKDMETRKAQYVTSINFHLKCYDLPIVFAENSGYDISGMFAPEIAEQRLEVITFNGNNYPESIGKGLGELNCINYALENSKLLAKADFVFKVTGRYTVRNLDTFLGHVRLDSNLFCLADSIISRRYTDSRFFGFKREFIYQCLNRYSKLLNDSNGVYFEHILFKAVLTALIDGENVNFFKTAAFIEGVAGSMNMQYKNGFLRRTYRRIKTNLKYYFFHNI